MEPSIIKCSSHPCTTYFTPKTIRQIYCSDLCNSREQMRRWRRKRPATYLAKKRRWHQKNKVRINEKRKLRYRTDAEFRAQCAAIRKKSFLKTLYGLTYEKKTSILDSQDNRCANKGCRTTDPGKRGWHSDHDHKTDRLRGFLCRPCNLALGLMKDDPAKLHGLAKYLEETLECGYTSKPAAE